MGTKKKQHTPYSEADLASIVAQALTEIRDLRIMNGDADFEDGICLHWKSAGVGMAHMRISSLGHDDECCDD